MKVCSPDGDSGQVLVPFQFRTSSCLFQSDRRKLRPSPAHCTSPPPCSSEASLQTSPRTRSQRYGRSRVQIPGGIADPVLL